MDYSKVSALDILLAAVRDEKTKFTVLPAAKPKKSDLYYTRFSKKAKAVRTTKVS